METFIVLPDAVVVRHRLEGQLSELALDSICTYYAREKPGTIWTMHDLGQFLDRATTQFATFLFDNQFDLFDNQSGHNQDLQLMLDEISQLKEKIIIVAAAVSGLSEAVVIYEKLQALPRY
jgi:hypothetical protein